MNEKARHRVPSKLSVVSRSLELVPPGAGGKLFKIVRQYFVGITPDSKRNLTQLPPTIANFLFQLLSRRAADNTAAIPQNSFNLSAQFPNLFNKAQEYVKNLRTGRIHQAQHGFTIPVHRQFLYGPHIPCQSDLSLSSFVSSRAPRKNICIQGRKNSGWSQPHT